MKPLVSDYAITFDIDWAPDFCIDFVAAQLLARNIKCSFFITHASEAIDRLRQHPELFELGIHPNFLSNTTHGKTEDEILRHCLSLVPNSRIVRTHALHQSASLYYKMITEFGIQMDLSCFLNKWENIRPNRIYYAHDQVSMLHLPYFWEDDHEMYVPDKSWEINNPAYHVEGMKIFNFHPAYVYLNGDSMHGYEKLKKKGYLATIPKDEFDAFINRDSKGAGSFFIDLLDWMASQKLSGYTVTDLKNKFESLGY